MPRARSIKEERTNAPTGRNDKCTFDRNSSTGRGKEGKKDDGGGHNWGSDKQDAKNAEGPVTQVAESPTEDPAAAPEKAAPPAEEVPAPEPKVDSTISYDDYLA